MASYYQPPNVGYGENSLDSGQSYQNQTFAIPTQNRFAPIGEWMGMSMDLEPNEGHLEWEKAQSKRRRVNTDHRMDNIVCSYVLVLAICAAVPASSTRPQRGSEPEASIGYSDRKLVKRGLKWFVSLGAAILLGKQATQTLQSGAMLIKMDGKLLWYIKSGDYKQAVKDFNSVRPTGVETYNVGGVNAMRGNVGDRRIVVDNGIENGKPTIEIIKGLNTPQKIVYRFTYMYTDSKGL